MAILSIQEIQSNAIQVAKLFDIKKVSLFGSYATGESTIDSDIDLLVEFNDIVSIYTLAGVKIKMEELTGKAVDIVPGPIAEDSLLEIDKEILLYEKK